MSSTGVKDPFSGIQYSGYGTLPLGKPEKPLSLPVMRQGDFVFFKNLQVCENFGYHEENFQRQTFATNFRKEFSGDPVDRRFAFFQDINYFLAPQGELFSKHGG